MPTYDKHKGSGTLVPELSFNKITLDGTSSTVEMYAKDYFKNGYFGWVANEQFNSVKIRVIQITEKQKAEQIFELDREDYRFLDNVKDQRIISSNPDSSNFLMTRDELDETCYVIPFSQMFEIPNEVEYLCYFCHMYIDIRELGNDLETDISLNLDDPNSSLIYGNLNSIVVVDNFENVSDLDNVVHDLRVIDEIKALDISVPSFSPENKKYPTELNIPKIPIPEKEPLFTELWLSKDYSNNTNCIFGVNIWSVLRENSYFSFMIDTLRQKQVLDPIVLFEFLSLVVTREKVKNLGVVSNTLQFDIEDFSEAELVDISNLEMMAASDLGIKDNSMIFFSFKDESTKELIAGKYIYNIKMTFKDNVQGWLKVLSSGLDNYVPKLEEALSVATSNPHNFNTSTSTYTVNFQNSRKANMSFSVLNSAIEYFMNVTSLLSPDFEISGALHIDSLDSLKNSTGLGYGSPAGIERLLDLYGDLILKVNNMISVTEHSLKNSDTGDKERSKRALTSMLFSIEKQFDTIINIDFEKRIGYNYLDEAFASNTSPSRNLRIMSGDAFFERAESETLRYFKSSNINIGEKSLGDLENTAFSFFTPFSIMTRDEEHALSFRSSGLGEDKEYTTHWDEKAHSNKETQIVIINEMNLRNNVENSVGLDFSPSEEVALGNTIRFASFKNMSIVRTDSTFSTEHSAAALENTNFIDILETKNFNKEFAELSEQEGEEINLLEFYQDFLLGFSKTNTSLADFDPKGNLAALSSQSLTENPNFYKWLILCYGDSDIDPIKKNWRRTGEDPFQNSSFRLLFENLVKIEYLAGFNSSERGVEPGMPDWRLMKNPRELFDNGMGQVMCRIKPVSQSNVYSLPIYDKYFLVNTSMANKYFDSSDVDY